MRRCWPNERAASRRRRGGAARANGLVKKRKPRRRQVPAWPGERQAPAGSGGPRRQGGAGAPNGARTNVGEARPMLLARLVAQAADNASSLVNNREIIAK